MNDLHVLAAAVSGEAEAICSSDPVFDRVLFRRWAQARAVR